MGGSGSRSAQELHRSPPCTSLHLPPARRQPRTAVSLPKCRRGPPKALSQQQCRRITVQKSSALRDGEVAVGRLRAGCESFQGYGDVSWPPAQVADVKAQDDLGTQRCLQHSDGSFLWKTGSGVISEMAHLTAGKQRVDKPVARPRSPRQREAPHAGRKATAPAVGHVAERCPAAARPPQPPPPEPPPAAAAAAAHSVDAAPRLRVCHDASASYAESSTSSRSSLAPDDSGISSSPSRVSLENRHDDYEGEECAKSRSPRPPAWKVRGFHEDELPNDLHRRFCEEIKSRYQLQTEEDRRRRVLAIKQIDAMVSQRMAPSVGREIATPHCRLQRRSQRCWVTSANKGGDRSNSSEMRSHLSSSAAEGKSANSEGRKSAQSGRDDITAIRGEVLLGQYPKFMLTNSYKDRLQQQADKNHYGSLNDANARQLPENYSPENNQERRHICDIFSKKLRKKTSETEKDDAHKADMCLKHVKEKRKDADKGSMPNEWRNARGETESANRTLDLSEIQTMTSRGKRCGQDKRESIIVHDWYGEGVGLHKQEQNEPDNLLRDGQWDQNDIKDLGSETPQRHLEQSDGRNVEEGNVSAQGSATSDLAARAMLRKDSVVMQLLLGGYFKQQHNQPCWPRIGALRRTSNRLDVSIRSCRDPVQKQSVETQTLPVHVSRRLTHVDEPRVESAPKIEIDHRGGRTRYYGLGREGSVGSLLSNRTPASPRGPQAGAGGGMADEERRPSYLAQERPPPAPSCASQRSHSDRSSHGRGPNAQWISPDTAFISSDYSRHASMAQSLAPHMCGNSTSNDRPRALPLKSEPEVNSGSHYRDTTSKSTVARSNRDQRKEGYQAVEHEHRKNSLWRGQIAPVSHSTPQEFALNEADTLFSTKKNSAETTNVRRLELPDRKPLTLEEELASVSLDTYNQHNRRELLYDPPDDFSRDSKGRSMPFSNRNGYGDELCHRSDHWGEGETKQKLPKQHSDQQYQDKTRKRFTPRHPRHSRHHRNSARRSKQEDKIAESDSGSEERISQPNIQPVRRVPEETHLSNSCRGKDSFDNLDNVLQANVTSDCKGGSKHHLRHHPRSERLIQDERKKETRDDAHLLIGSTGHSGDSVTKSSASLLCHCCREEEEEATSLDQCNVRKFNSDRKKIEKRNSRRSVDQPLICATEKKPFATVVRKSNSRVNQERPYERNDSQDEDLPYCRSSCCCTCHKTRHRPRFQPDVSGWQATHVAKRAHCSGTASASDTPCCCQDQQSVQCGAGGCDLCSACRRELRGRGDGPASERRSFHECYCGSRRVCYSILEDEEEAAAAEEAKGSGCGFARALSFFHNHTTGDWSQ